MKFIERLIWLFPNKMAAWLWRMLPDHCQRSDCKGGGVRDNENVHEGMSYCDYCWVEHIHPKREVGGLCVCDYEPTDEDLAVKPGTYLFIYESYDKTLWDGHYQLEAESLADACKKFHAHIVKKVPNHKWNPDWKSMLYDVRDQGHPECHGPIKIEAIK